jgi:hypothetical protein
MMVDNREAPRKDSSLLLTDGRSPDLTSTETQRGDGKKDTTKAVTKAQRHSVVAKTIPKSGQQKKNKVLPGQTHAVVLKGKSHLYSQHTMKTHQLIKKWVLIKIWVNTLEDIVG